MSTGWEDIGVNSACSGEGKQGVGGGNAEGNECGTLVNKHINPGQISDRDMRDTHDTDQLKGANTKTESRKRCGMDFQMSYQFDASKNRVVELMSSDGEWGSRGVMNLVGKVLRGKFCMDDDVEDTKYSETENAICSFVEQNGRLDVNKEPIVEKGSVINEFVVSNDLHVDHSNWTRVETGGKENLVINEPFSDDIVMCDGVLECESDCKMVSDCKSECGGHQYSESESQRVPDKLEILVQPDSKVEADGLGDIGAVDSPFLEGTCEEYKKDSEYNVSDIVWGKVRSHPWWPGQIFRPSAASDTAMAHFKKDCHLIAYFGDQTFSWTDLSKIRPFRPHFSEMEKQNSAEIFCDAVNCSLDEIARRVEFGLACMCLPKEVYAKIRSQVVHNTGIREKSSIVDGGDSLSSAALFLPGNLLHFIKSFAGAPGSHINRLDLGITKAQLLAFNRWKGYDKLPSFEPGELLEGDREFPVDGENVPQDMVNGVLSDSNYTSKVPSKMGRSTIKGVSLRKCKHKENDECPRMKGKCTSVQTSSRNLNLSNDEKCVRKMAKKMVSSSKKRGLGHSTQSDSNVKRQKTVLGYAPSGHNLSVGERVCRAFESGDKCAGHAMPSNGKKIGSKAGKSVASEMTLSNFDPDEILLKLNLAAKNPLQGHGISASMIGLLHQIRNSSSQQKPSVENLNKVVEKNSGKKQQSLNFEVLKGAKDASVTDRFIEGSKDQELPNYEIPMERDVSSTELNANTCVIVRLDNQIGTENSTVPMNEGSREDHPTALVLKFTDSKSIPSVPRLNEIFMRYGSLIESHTKVLRKSKRAKIFFHKVDDAERAFSSSGKYSIFGPSLASYSLHYEPYKTCTSSKRKSKAE